MRKNLLVFLFTSLCLSLFANNDIVDRQVLVQFDNYEQGERTCQKLFPNETIELISKNMNIWLVTFKDSIPFNYIQKLNVENQIKNATRNQRLQTRATPNDTFYLKQNHLTSYVSPNKSSSYGIQADKAWDFNTSGVTANGDTIVIAILDEGFDLYHEDLDYFVNRNEIPYDSIDNDNNGAIDDYIGWNVRRNNHEINAINTRHGMPVAGLAAAKGNNKIGVTGVSQNAKVLPVADLLDYALSIKALDYCIEMKKQYWATNGAKGAYIVAINYSIGTVGLRPNDQPMWCEAFDRLSDVGILVTTAADDNYVNCYAVGDMPILCNSPNMISTTAYDSTNFKITVTAYDSVYVDLVAPGKNFSLFPNNQYGYTINGTSNAAPLVAGTIGLMYSQFSSRFLDSIKADPACMSQVIKRTLLNNVDTFSTLKGMVSSGGRLSTYRAVDLSRTLEDSLKSCFTDTVIIIDSPIGSINQYQLANQNLYAYNNNLIAKNLAKHTLYIYNMLSQQLLKHEIKNENEIVDLHFLERGIYIALASDETSKLAIKLVIE